MSEHTKELWEVVGFGEGKECDDWSAENDTAGTYETVPIMAGGKTVALVVITGWDSSKLEANASRIVACVNACAELETEELEREPTSIKMLLKKLRFGIISATN